MILSSRLRLTALVAVDTCAFVILTPNWPGLIRHLMAPHAWVAAVGADDCAAAVIGAALLVALWVGIGLTAMLTATLPGRLGAVATQVARRTLPAALQRALVAAVGLSILATPAIAGARTPAHAHGIANSNGVTAPSWPDTGRPLSNIDLGWPGAVAGSISPSSPPAVVGQLSQQSGVGTEAVAGAIDHRVVAPGESLWQIAAQVGGGAEPAEVPSDGSSGTRQIAA